MTLSYSQGGQADDRDFALLRERLETLRVQQMEHDFQLPPNPSLKPTQFVSSLLNALWNNADPLPDSGFRVLLRSSTEHWRSRLYHSVGAPSSASLDAVASALGEAMSRPHNQFAILVAEAEDYQLSFPTEPVDYADGTCWLECRLRHKDHHQLLVVTGWQLQKQNGAWMVDGIDWQDFRDEYRPGIGREEWMRICG